MVIYSGGGDEMKRVAEYKDWVEYIPPCISSNNNINIRAGRFPYLDRRIEGKKFLEPEGQEIEKA